MPAFNGSIGMFLLSAIYIRYSLFPENDVRKFENTLSNVPTFELGNSLVIDDCVSLTRLKPDDCARMDSSIDHNASACVARCGLSQHAYALMHNTDCRCFNSELYKLTDFVNKHQCYRYTCSDFTFCGGVLQTENSATDCRYENYWILIYSSFIANSSGITSTYLGCHDFAAHCQNSFFRIERKFLSI